MKNDIETIERNLVEIEKENKRKSLLENAGMILLMLLVLAILSVASFAPAKNIEFIKKAHIAEYISSRSFAYQIGEIIDAELNPDDKLLSESRELRNIKYTIKYTDGKTINGKPVLTNIEEADFSEQKFQTILDESIYFGTINIDSQGEVLFKEMNGVIDVRSYEIKEFLEDKIINDTKYRNIELMFAIPQDFGYHVDRIQSGLINFFSETYAITILSIGVIGILILIIMAFSINYKKQKNTSICHLFNIMPLELKMAAWIIWFACLAETGNTLSHYNISQMLSKTSPLFYLIGITIVFTLYIMLYLSMVYIKCIYHEGFITGLVKKSISGKIALWILRKLKRLIKSILEIDLTKAEYKKLILIMGINLVIIILFIAMGPFGVILACGYSGFLVFYFKKNLQKLQLLNTAAESLANGDLNVNIEEDMGLLEPIAKNLKNIQSGFKLAVEKEIKSQSMKTELIANVSHDLKTPLTSIINYVDLLKKEELQDERQREYVDILDKKSQRLKILIEDLFEASKANSGNIELNLEKIDTIALLRQTLGEFEDKVKSKGLDIKAEIPEEKLYSRLDGKRAYRIFENIMSNIVKYSMERSRVYINIESTETEIRFIFKNISSYEMNFDVSEITERFTRGDKARTTEGSGLGLSIAKSLVEVQGGSFEIFIDGDLFKSVVTFKRI